ncbi:helix-turn-helix transcriptional regulator [Candidatus Marinimicrobia bacterium]|nr:helix-turn-helix transcriptional regulator [Candidatus Neomarinimicrobiota bacterium]
MNNILQIEKIDIPKEEECPLTYAMKVTGGKWKPIILSRLSQGINRFGVLSRSIEGISKNMLTQQLRQMESNKIINRKIFAEIPPRVEYSLTTRGESLLPIFKSLADWGSIHQND